MKWLRLTGFIAIALVVAILLCLVPFSVPVSADRSLIISDCTSGWSYSGNSEISYSAAGTDGNGLSVKGSYGALRTLTYSTKSLNLSGYSYIEWDMKAVGGGKDVLFDVINTYRDSFHLTITDSKGGYAIFYRNDIKIVRASDNWYHARVRIDENTGFNIGNISSISIVTLENNAFDTSIPSTVYTFDTLVAAGAITVEPEIVGVRYKGDSVRCIAKIDRRKYEQFSNTYKDIKYGFLAAPYEIFKSGILSFNSPLGYESFLADKLYVEKGDGDNLYFLCDIAALSDTYTIIVRAFVSYVDESGINRVLYSVDGLTGGYEVNLGQVICEADAKEVIENMHLDSIPDDSSFQAPTAGTVGVNVTAGKPYAVPLKYNIENEVCVAIYDVVRDFSAPVNNLNADSSAAIQKALNFAKAKGGGVVYLPEGKYRCNKPITIPSGVTLRGEWLPPEKVTASTPGSVLYVYTGDISVCQTQFVSLGTGAGIRNLNIFYPGMANGSFSEYSATIAETATYGGDSFTVENISVLGGSVGYDAATSWSELHTLKNVYFSSFKEAIKINNVTDIGRLEKIRISPDYFTNNVYQPLESRVKALALAEAKKADGLVIQRSDWQYVYDLKISGVKSGIVFKPYYDINDDNRKRGSNGQMFGVDISECSIALDVQYANAIGYALTNIKIYNCDVGFIFSDEYLSSFEITNLEMRGESEAAIISNALPEGKITVTNSLFDTSGNVWYSVEVNGGGMSLQQCEFASSNRHVYVGTGALSVSVLGCKFPRASDIFRPQDFSGKVMVDHTPLDLPVMDLEHTYKSVLPVPKTRDVYCVTDYGAASGVDSTEAFKSALLAAGITGGTVYVPAGEYIINEPLNIPSGVELKGIYDVPTHSVTSGSVLCTDHGKNDESADPFITLSEGSGISGIEFYYISQTFSDFIPYSYTVQSRGKNCWARNCVFVNSYNALDFGTYPSEGHYIQYVSGSPLRRGIFVGNNSKNGWVENVQFNPHYWKRANISMIDLTDQDLLNDAVNTTLESMIFGDNASEHVLSTFGYGAKNLLKFVSQGKGGTNGVFIGHGSDGCRNALVAEQIGNVYMINSELVSMNGTGDMYHINLKSTVTGTLCLFNTSAWANPKGTSIRVDGGNLLVCQMFYHNLEYTDHIAEVSAGKLYISSCMLPHKNRFFVAYKEGLIRSKGNLYKQLASKIQPSNAGYNTLINGVGRYFPTNCWWI